MYNYIYAHSFVPYLYIIRFCYTIYTQYIYIYIYTYTYIYCIFIIYVCYNCIAQHFSIAIAQGPSRGRCPTSTRWLRAAPSRCHGSGMAPWDGTSWLIIHWVFLAGYEQQIPGPTWLDQINWLFPQVIWRLRFYGGNHEIPMGENRNISVSVGISWLRGDRFFFPFFKEIRVNRDTPKLGWLFKQRKAGGRHLNKCLIRIANR